MTGRLQRLIWPGTDLRQVYNCGGGGSELHLILEGQHALDICLSGNPLLQEGCFAGSERSAEEVSDSIGTAITWSRGYADAASVPNDSTGGGSSGGTASFLSMLAMVVLLVHRRPHSGQRRRYSH